MRKSLLLIICTFLLIISNAQIKKGTILLGGDFSFNTQTSKDGTNKYKSNGFTFSPVFAKAVKQNIFWGGSVSYSSVKNTPAQPNINSKYKTYGAEVFYRRYHPVKNKFYFFLQGGAFASFAKNEYRQSPDYYFDEKGIFAGLNITPGVSFAVTKKLYLESGFSNIASLNYQHSEVTGYNFGNSIDRSSDSFGFSSSLGVFSSSLYFGFRFMIDNKKG